MTPSRLESSAPPRGDANEVSSGAVISARRGVVAEDAVESSARPVHGARQAQEAGVVVQREDQPVRLEQQLQRIGVGAQVPFLDRLMDRALDDNDLQRIEAILASFRPRGCSFDNLRTRAAGAMRFAHVDMRVPGSWSVAQAHDLADEVEDAVLGAGITLDTHVEPIE